jgi:hypothetical protein
LLSLGSLGCSQSPLRVGKLPWSADEDPYLPPDYPTPARRMAKMKELAAAAESGPPEQQSRAAAELARQIQTETDENIRLHIVLAISQLDTPLAEEVLEAGLNDGNAEVRVACCNAWGERGGQAAVSLLAETINRDTDLDVRLAAIRALGRIREPGTVAALTPALEDPNPAVQYRTVQSLRNVYERDLGNDVNAWRQMAAGQTDIAPPTVAERLRNLF